MGVRVRGKAKLKRAMNEDVIEDARHIRTLQTVDLEVLGRTAETGATKAILFGGGLVDGRGRSKRGE